MDALEKTFREFYKERDRSLYGRFPGSYRAVVVETNDPLNMGRIRFKMAEMHNEDLKPDECPWAVSGTLGTGGRGGGDWASPNIGDIVWISFEKDHAYGPIWSAPADPTRRKFYPHQSIHGPTPVPLDEEGKPEDAPDDFLEEYLPKDSRPMSSGSRDGYGSFFIMNAVGFFPKEHREAAAPAGTDAFAQNQFNRAQAQPEVNGPDLKYMAMCTKYGTFAILGDQGYEWDNSEGGGVGEFQGDFIEDEEFEIARSKYLLRLFNEDTPSGRDQRRYEIRTRAGHKFEMRDVGWQKTRQGEYDGGSHTISNSTADERWIKLRSKGGHVFELLDVGFDPENDLEYKKLLISDVGESDQEDEISGDKRMIRMNTRYGFTMILDDRGSDAVDSFGKEEPRGNGFLVKGRRDQKGFGIEFNEKDQLNRMAAYTPQGNAMELNDKFGYSAIVSGLSESLSEDRGAGGGFPKKTFSRKTILGLDARKTTFLLLADAQNKTVSATTPGGAGFEAHDDPTENLDPECPECEAFVEVRDQEGRGMYMSKKEQLLAIRSKNKNMHIVFEDNEELMIIENTNGSISIKSSGTVQIEADDIVFKSKNSMNFEAAKLGFKAGGTDMSITSGGVKVNSVIKSDRIEGVLKGNRTYNVKGGDGGTVHIPDIGQPSGTVDTIALPPQFPLLDFTGGAGGADGGGGGEPGDTRLQPTEAERGCDCDKEKKGEVPIEVVTAGGGGGGGGGPGTPQPPPGDNSPPIDDPVIPPAPPGPGILLWYGLSSIFKDEILEVGLNLDSLTNNENIPGSLNADRIKLATTEPIADGRTLKEFAKLSQCRYGERRMILRIRDLTNKDNLRTDPTDPNVFLLLENVPPEFIEIFEIKPDELDGIPQFPEVAEDLNDS